MKFEDLPVDIVDRILVFIPDFPTLRAALLTSKNYIYNVYQEHPNSIFQSVASSVSGAALRQALISTQWAKSPGAMDDLPDEEAPIEILLSNNVVVSTLERNAEIVSTLEVFYSRR